MKKKNKEISTYLVYQFPGEEKIYKRVFDCNMRLFPIVNTNRAFLDYFGINHKEIIVLEIERL